MVTLRTYKLTNDHVLILFKLVVLTNKQFKYLVCLSHFYCVKHIHK